MQHLCIKHVACKAPTAKRYSKIVESGNDYTIKVKRKQKSLLDSIQQQSEKSSPVKTYHSKEETRGRLTERIIKRTATRIRSVSPFR